MWRCSSAMWARSDSRWRSHARALVEVGLRDAGVHAERGGLRAHRGEEVRRHGALGGAA